MKLTNVLKGIKYDIFNGDTDIGISNINYDSRRIEKNGLYIAIRWTHVNGNKYISDAIRRGAIAVVTDENVELTDNNITVIKVENAYKNLFKIASNFYGKPADKLNIIGITGTNGKTTTTYILKSIFEEREDAAVIGTIKYILGDKEIPAPNTTPDALVLNRFFAEVVDRELKTVIMEVSSHAIALGRIDGMRFNTVAFTNLTGEHLDFHKNMENYFNVKKSLFMDYPSLNKLVNIDDVYGKRLFSMIKENPYSYSLRNRANFYADDIKITKQGVEFNMDLEGKKVPIKSSLLGEYNIYNILLASAIAYLNGFSMEEIKSGVEKVKNVEGRTEILRDGKSGIDAIVDYAHTPDALERLLKFAKEGGFWKHIILTFGCGGDRDSEKRPKMGKIACKYADSIILTNDNPRTEEPEKIIAEIESGMYCRHIVETDRARAIEKAIKMATFGDVVIVAGKGHEDYQILGDGKIHFSDREEIIKRFA